MHWRIGTVVAVAFVTALFLTAEAGAGVNGQRVVFTSTRGGGWAPYTVGVDGTGEQRLPTPARQAFEGDATWSPDGTRLAYVCGNFELCAMNADGSGQVRLTQSAFSWPTTFSYELDPSWSPDGTRVAFASNRESSGYDIFVANADGSGVTRVGGTGGNDAGPSWSPDGSKLVFSSDTTGNGDLYVMNADGSGLRRLTATKAQESNPDWSPDGTQILYELAAAQTDLAVVSPEGIGAHRLTKTPTEELDPAWSPDGTQIVFASDAGGNWDIYLLSRGVRRRLTNSPAADLFPDWQPAAGMSPGRVRTAPPTVATEDARVVAAVELWTAKLGGEFPATDPPSIRQAIKRVMLFRKDSGRAKRAVSALHPQSSRGKRLQRVSARAFAESEGFAREAEVFYVLLSRGKRKAAASHLARSGTYVGAFADDLTTAYKLTGLP